MNAYKVFIGSILFFALFTGATNFQNSFFNEQGVDGGTPTEINAQYDNLQNRVDSMRSNVRQIQSPETSILDSVVAGLYLVPDFLGIILAPITILTTTIDAIAASHVFIPQFVATALKSMIVIGVSWSAFRLLIGLNG